MRTLQGFIDDRAPGFVSAAAACLALSFAVGGAWAQDPRARVADDAAVVEEQRAPAPAGSIALVADAPVQAARFPVADEAYDPNIAAELQASDDEARMRLANGRAGGKSILVYLDPAQDAGGPAAPGFARRGVRQLAGQRNLSVRYEYDILPNVINIRGATQRDMDALRAIPGVVRIEEDQIYHVSLHDSVPLIRGLESQKSAAGFSARGNGVRVCIIDTGIRADHVMFTGRIDAAAGYDYYNDDSNPADDHGHGSNVAGIAAGGDGFTVSFGTCGPEPFQGVAPGATLIAVKVCSAGGSCPTSDIVAGINHCASAALPGGQADVINLSLGGGQFSGTCDAEASAAAANNAVAAGVTVVAAAGNNGFTNALGSPACGSQVMAIAAVYDSNFPNCQDSNSSFTWCLNSFCTSTCTDNPALQDGRVCFSNRSVNLDVAAPGSVIWSAAISGGTNSIASMSGTSQASPHAAGLAALIIGLDPSLTPTEVRQIIRDGSVDLGAAGFDTNYGYGRIDVIDSLNLVAPPQGCTTDGDCDDGVACTTDTCNQPAGTCTNAPNDAACDNGLFCDGAETCDPVLDCQAGSPPNCDDGVGCTADSCNEATDSCDNVPSDAACDDGLFCTGVETCDPALDCQPGSDPCLPGESCNEATDTCEPSPCNDNGTCEAGEDCNNCPADCPTGAGASCGNGVCEAGDGEDCVICPADCNGLQSGRPQNRFCCGDGDGQNPVPCSNPACTAGSFSCTDQPAVPSCCGDLVCEGSETSFNCELDCGAPATCGNAICEAGEDSCNCSADCGAPPATESSCTDGIDNDCDTFTDCNDADCGTDPACACAPKGASCTADADCCSLSCKPNGTCR